MIRLLSLIAWCFAAPFLKLLDTALVVVGLKRRAATGAPVWVTRKPLPTARTVRR